MSCPAAETAAAWLIGQLSESESETFEQHYFECEACFERARRLERTLQVLTQGLPFTLTPPRREALLAQGPLQSVDVEPGQRALLHLSSNAPAALWVMHFAAPAVERVDLEARSSTDEKLFAVEDVAFDAEQSRVYMPCQLHYQHVFPGESTLVITLTSRAPDGTARELGRYILDHRYDSA
jgi:anti-sigma factor RsiW